MNNRSLFRKKESIPILALLLLCLLLFALFSTSAKGDTVVVEKEGQAAETFTLGQNRTLQIGGDYPLAIVISGGEVWIKEAACPDKTCVRTGKISHSGQVALCLPARVCVRITGGTGFDAVTY